MSRSVQIGLRRCSAIPPSFVVLAGLLLPACSLKRVAVNVLGDAIGGGSGGDEPFPRLLPVRQAPDPGVPVCRPVLHRPACGSVAHHLSSRPHDRRAGIGRLEQLRFRLPGTGWHGANGLWGRNRGADVGEGDWPGGSHAVDRRGRPGFPSSPISPEERSVEAAQWQYRENNAILQARGQGAVGVSWHLRTGGSGPPFSLRVLPKRRRGSHSMATSSEPSNEADRKSPSGDLRAFPQPWP